jgi:hypothetical protein
MTQQPATLLDREPYPVEDDDLGSLPGYLGTRRIDRAAPPDLRVETTPPGVAPIVLHPRILGHK